ncbi:hypothetical protein MCOR25_003100 [Pyricularia grisea]|nr:hypothetical protein MCOR25_003100 [Pyricularia grisea]
MEHNIPIRTRPAATTCRFFASGRCAKGTSCPFPHVTPRDMARPEQNTVQQYSKKAVTCHYFLAGACKRGDACVFLHQTPARTEIEDAEASADADATVPRSSQLPCRYFARGECRSGEACLFQHDASQAPSRVIDGYAEQPDADEQQDDWTRVFGGAIVRYGDGCSVSKVSLTTDFSAVRLGNIPEGSTQDTIIQMLRDSGVDVPQEITVRIRPGDRNADLRAEDPEFATVVRNTMTASGSEITAVRTEVPEPQGSGLHRVDCRRVHCSWYRPMRTVWINFYSRNAAQKVHDRFVAGTFKIDGQVIKVGALPGGFRDHEARTVMLTEIDNAITAEDVKNSISDAYRQEIKHVELGKETYRVRATELIARVKMMLEEIGPLESWMVIKSGQGKRIKAQATFADETDARIAAETLNNGQIRPPRLGFLSNPAPKLTVQHITVAKFKLATRVYSVLRDRLEAQRVQWEDQHILFNAYPPEKGHRVLRLQADDKTVVAAAQRTLAEIVGGELMKLEKSHWSIVTKDVAFRRGLNGFFKSHRVVVTIDRRRCQLRLFGNANDRELVKGLITSLLDKHAADDQHVIELSQKDFLWACHGGFRALTTHLGGEGKVAFDIISKPKRIVCTGTEADYQEAIKFIAAKDASRPDAEIPAGEDQEETDCSVCWTPADDAVTTTCGHVYCTGCLADMSQSELTAATQYTLCCVGAANTCQAPLPLPELQSHISSTSFEDALEASFTGYIRRHPDLFRYCPTPDCGRIYRCTTSNSSTTTKPASFTCPQCMATTCTACHALHEGMSCADHRDLASGGHAALERVKKELGVKDCPRCGTAIEKTEGCNHMTCLGCKCHICWKCLATFDTAGGCYHHLRERHGGVFDYDARWMQ